MPNVCQNRLTVMGSPAAVDLFTPGDGGLLHAVVPPPTSVLRAADMAQESAPGAEASRWREWVASRWATPRDATDVDVEQAASGTEATLAFVTAHTPPITAVLLAAAILPGATLRLEFSEPLADLHGTLRCDGDSAGARGRLTMWSEGAPEAMADATHSGHPDPPADRAVTYRDEVLTLWGEAKDIAGRVVRQWETAGDSTVLVDAVCDLVERGRAGRPRVTLTLDELRRNHGAPRLLAELGWLSTRGDDFRRAAAAVTPALADDAYADHVADRVTTLVADARRDGGFTGDHYELAAASLPH